MSDLQKLRESILAKAHQEGQAQLEKAKAEHEQEFQEKLKHVTRDKESQRSYQLERETQKLARLEQQMANQERQENLKSRQSLIDELFDGAAKQMTNWPSDQLITFIKSILNQFSSKEVRLTFGSLTKNQLTQEAIDSIKSDYSNVTIEENVIENGAGFILKDGRVDYNFMFEQLVASLRDEMSAELAQQVFNAN